MTEKQDLGHIYTVSGLTREIKELLEESYPFVWITGEISNYALPSSGHSYFSLKDDNAVISCVMFRNQRKRLQFNPENGMKITGLGRLSLYEPRGSYQIILEHMAPDGVGALQVRFDQLKKQLSREGLFDEKHKQELPFLPSKVSIVTSPTGAVIQDIIHVATRRFPGIHLEVVPVKVQGKDSEHEIKHAIEAVNRMETMEGSDLIIIARGGGSLEDLAAFNSETVARAVFASHIPVVSAVGHETDFTICDFVADVRVPTPSSAAEVALPEKRILANTVGGMENALCTALYRRMDQLRQHLQDLHARLKNPVIMIQEMHLKRDDLEQRLINVMAWNMSGRHEKLKWLVNALHTAGPQKKMPTLRDDTEQLNIRLSMAMAGLLQQFKTSLCAAHAKLEALSPMAVLDRGYCISRRCRDNKIIQTVSETNLGDDVEIILSKGIMFCEVEETFEAFATLNGLNSEQNKKIKTWTG